MNKLMMQKYLAAEYLSHSLHLKQQNGTCDDYDIRLYSGKEYQEIGHCKMALLRLANDLLENSSGLKHFCRVNANLVSVYNSNSEAVPVCQFSLLTSPFMTFSGTIGINDLELDCGKSKHLRYLGMFFDRNDLACLREVYIGGSDKEHVLNSYIGFYQRLADFMSSNPISIFKLMSGIKTAYYAPDMLIYLDGEQYHVLDFSKLHDSKLWINNFSNFSIEASDTSPYLKISCEGNKLLHIRTKSDVKNSGYKLRFFIETSSKFLDLFKKDKIYG